MAIVDSIKKLHTSMINTRRAYVKAQHEAQEPSLKQLFAEMVALRDKDHHELHQMLIEMGEKPSEDGSFMMTVHMAVIAVRAAVKGVDRGSLSAFADGEQNIVREYDEALGQDDISAPTSDLLERQRKVLLAKIGQMNAGSG